MHVRASLHFFKYLSNPIFFLNHLPQFLQSRCVGRFRKPEFEISVAAVFLVKMLHHPFVLPFFGELRIMVEAILYGATDYRFRVDETVGLCHDAAIDSARLVFRRGAMVFSGISHSLNLLFSKPFPQILIRFYDLRRHLMMTLATIAKTCIVVRRDDINHISVNVEMPGNFKTLLDYHSDMVTTVSRVERIVTRDDFLFYIRNNVRINRHWPKIPTYFFTGSHVKPIPNFLKILRSTSGSITVECT